MNKLAIGALALLALASAASIAEARPGDCDDDWGCGMNGTQLTGIVLPGAAAGGITIQAVKLPSGETVNQR